MKRQPALFLAHGSPMNAVEKNSYTDFLQKLSQKIQPPKAIIAISAHWVTRGTLITADIAPKQIYDFRGFPDELYRIRYEPPGPPVAHANSRCTRLTRRLGAVHQNVRKECPRPFRGDPWRITIRTIPKN